MIIRQLCSNLSFRGFLHGFLIVFRNSAFVLCVVEIRIELVWLYFYFGKGFIIAFTPDTIAPKSLILFSCIT